MTLFISAHVQMIEAKKDCSVLFTNYFVLLLTEYCRWKYTKCIQ